MDSLRPERDELDQFKNRKGKGGPKKPVQRPPKEKSDSGKSGAFQGFLILLLIVAVGALGWGYYEQQKRLTTLRAELEDASGFIGQSKLLLARLEGDLNETGAELEQSGSQVQRKLAFLDSEMRKLWGVSNDRNKKAIQSNSDEISGLRSEIKRLETASKKALSEQRQEQTQKLQQLNTRIDQLAETLQGMESRVSLAASEAAVTRESINQEIAKMQSSVGQLGSIKKTLQENEQTIASINESRRQLIQRIISLEDELNAVRLKLDKSP